MSDDVTLDLAREAGEIFTEKLFYDLMTRNFMQTSDGLTIVPVGHIAFYVMRGICPKCGKRRLKRNRCVLSRCRKCKWKPV